MKQITLFLGLAFAAAVSAQTSGVLADGVYATAYRTVSITPTDATISVTVTTNTTKALDDVLAKLRDTKVTIDNLTGLRTTESPVPSIPSTSTYSFLVFAPLNESRAVTQAITAKADTDFRISASVATVTASKAAVDEAQKRLAGELFQEAKERAQALAQAANVNVGRTAMVSETGSPVYYAGFAVSSQVTFAITVKLAIE